MEVRKDASGAWGLEQPPLEAVNRSLIVEREDLFYVLAAASFVEIAADLYTDNLISFFSGDEEAVRWLDDHWKTEEMRHGQVLRAYVRHVWPEFDCDRAYASFFADYSLQCTVDEFEPTRGLEMVARCVVETGTSTFYQALAGCTDEPILQGIANRIRAEEISHYKHFYHLFRKYRSTEQFGRLQIIGALKRRVFEARSDDAECALWHVYHERNPAARRDDAQFQTLVKQIGREIRQHYPIAMAAKMLLRPLQLPNTLNRLIEGPLARWTGKVFLN
jgi:hypothetical protein